jgi:predicted ribosome quality control (RQC) complex YloA/Tae2 family protein
LAAWEEPFIVQSVDYTTLMSVCAEIRREWVPAKVEQIYQRDRFTLYLALRTLKRRGWLCLCWHPQAARLCMAAAPPKIPDTFTFSEQLRHQLNGLALIDLVPWGEWERVIDLQFAPRPQAAVEWHLWVEVMNKYSNVILTNGSLGIVTAAHQVSQQQSRVRPIQTGQPYQFPPQRLLDHPKRSEPQEHWQQKLALIPQPISRALTQVYTGVSPGLAISMVVRAQLQPMIQTQALSSQDWERLFEVWQCWLSALADHCFQPAWTATGYTVLGWGATTPVASVSTLLDEYYCQQMTQQTLHQLHHQLSHAVITSLEKLQQKAAVFGQQLQAAADAEQVKGQADLLMAHWHLWQPGQLAMTVLDFESGEPVSIPLNPEFNAIQNAQRYYKRHQKLKRSQEHLQPLLAALQVEIQYLEQVEAAIEQNTVPHDPQAPLPPDSLQKENIEQREALEEIREELIQQGYLPNTDPRRPPATTGTPLGFTSPGGWTVLVGRNNQQNDRLTFRQATRYDVWFHTQEIAGAHVLLRLDAGMTPDPEDLQFCANLAARFSRARHSDRVPVVYTQPRHVYKPKGAKPGMAIYKHETVLWGDPHA